MEIHLSQIIFQLINFGLVTGALSFLVFKPVRKIFEKRRKKIEAGQKAAERNLVIEKKLAAKKKEILQEAKKEAAEILKRANKEATTKKETLLQKARAEAKEIIEKGEKSWQNEKEQLKTEWRLKLIELALLSTKKLIKIELSKKKQTEIINQEIETLTQKI